MRRMAKDEGAETKSFKRNDGPEGSSNQNEGRDYGKRWWKTMKLGGSDQSGRPVLDETNIRPEYRCMNVFAINELVRVLHKIKIPLNSHLRAGV